MGLAVLQRLNATLLSLPDGAAGTRATLRLMAGLARQYRKSMPIRSLALDIVNRVPGKNFAGEARELCLWVRNNIRYTRDVRDVETLQTPLKTLDIGQGDCDDQATLLSSLLEAVGFKTRFLAIKTATLGPFVHVICEAYVVKEWVPLETTEPWEPGTFPIRFAGSMIEHV
jgi:transglutaminase-like putative cysteine protease